MEIQSAFVRHLNVFYSHDDDKGTVLKNHDIVYKKHHMRCHVSFMRDVVEMIDHTFLAEFATHCSC